MKGYIIGAGKEWRKVAEMAAARMQAMTGVAVEVYVPRKKYVHPAWGKTEIAITEPTLVMDADLWCARPWCPMDHYKPGAISAVVEPANRAVDRECQLYGIDREYYFNAGLMILGPECADMPTTTASYHPHYGRWLEQTAWNKVAMGRVQRMAPEFNHLLRREHTPAEVMALPYTNIHHTGSKPGYLINLYSQLV